MGSLRKAVDVEVTADDKERIETFRVNNRLASKAEALMVLVKRGLQQTSPHRPKLVRKEADGPQRRH